MDSDRTFELGDYDPTLYGFYDVRKDIEEWRSANFNNTLDESNSTTTTILVKQDDEQPIMMIVKNLVGLGGAIQAAKDGGKRQNIFSLFIIVLLFCVFVFFFFVFFKRIQFHFDLSNNIFPDAI